MATPVHIDGSNLVLPSSTASTERRVDTRPYIGYNHANCSPPSEPSGPNWRGLSIPVTNDLVEVTPHD